MMDGAVVLGESSAAAAKKRGWYYLEWRMRDGIHTRKGFNKLESRNERRVQSHCLQYAIIQWDRHQ